jgi:TorA maturation chaperone TorD
MLKQNDIIIRSDCFRLLAACLYEPDKDMFLEEKVCENLAGLLADSAPGAVQAAWKMAKALREIDQEQLSRDHAALFVGPFELLAAPYGSVYLEKGRRVMGDSTIEVARFYRQEGLEVDVSEPPDHIAIELEFLSFLAQKEALAEVEGLADEADRCRQVQARFLEGYLQPWLPVFCEAVRAGTENRFYLALAECLEGCISSFGRRCRAPEPVA